LGNEINFLTDKQYWDENWKTIADSNKIFEKPKLGITSTTIGLMSVFSKYIKPNDKVLEIGAAPGFWLTHINKRLGGRVYGIDYSDVGHSITKKMYEKRKVKGEIINGDVFDETFLAKYNSFFDVVYSLGFVEHFADLLPAIAAHIKLLRQGGVMIINIPNYAEGSHYRWANKRRGLEQMIVTRHNTALFSLQTFQDCFKHFKEIEVLSLGYQGPLEIQELVPTTGFFFHLKLQYPLEPLALFTGFLILSMKSRIFSRSLLAIAQKTK
jgi:SAM-dependent methyltransferase